MVEPPFFALLEKATILLEKIVTALEKGVAYLGAIKCILEPTWFKRMVAVMSVIWWFWERIATTWDRVVKKAKDYENHDGWAPWLLAKPLARIDSVLQLIRLDEPGDKDLVQILITKDAKLEELRRPMY